MHRRRFFSLAFAPLLARFRGYRAHGHGCGVQALQTEAIGRLVRHLGKMTPAGYQFVSDFEFGPQLKIGSTIHVRRPARFVVQRSPQC